MPSLPLFPLPATRLIVAALLPCLGLTGCVSSKYRIASAVGAQPQRMDLELGGQPVKTRLDAIIIYQGPGSWKASAYWDELLVTFHNGSDERVIVTAASLVDYAGSVVPAGTDPWQLEKASLAQRERYERAGVSFALNTLGYVALTYGAVGAGALVGGAATSSWAGLAAGATVGLVAVPVTAIAIYANNQKHKHQIEGEFNRRRVVLPLALNTGETRAGSLFFPMTVSPQSLRLEWIRGGEHGVSLLPLPMLAGLHQQAPATRSAK